MYNGMVINWYITKWYRLQNNQSTKRYILQWNIIHKNMDILAVRLSNGYIYGVYGSNTGINQPYHG
jgi:hypothetical protein